MNTFKYRSPWKNYSDLFGTDALQFQPNLNKDTKVNAYLDQLCRSGSFLYHNTKDYEGLSVLRFT
jgi:hypothetical protein